MKYEYFTIKPSLKQNYGVTVKKDTVFDETNSDGTVHQTLKDLLLTTEINKTTDYEGIKIEQSSIVKVSLKEGTILLWTDEEGFIVPSVPLCNLSELEEEIKEIKKIYQENNKDIVM